MKYSVVSLENVNDGWCLKFKDLPEDKPAGKEVLILNLNYYMYPTSMGRVNAAKMLIESVIANYEKKVKRLQQDIIALRGLELPK